ncbi:MAG: DUF333 domain-containing protein [archaeon]|jgi:hypothetical protein
MKQYFVFLIALLALLLFFGCTQEIKGPLVACTEEAKLCPNGSAVGRVAPNCEFAPCPVSQNTQIANPASTNCIDQNGNLEIVDTNEGQIGMCTLPSGKVCEEWALFRNECN